MANIVICILAIFLCLVNAVVWAFITEMPLMGIAWTGAAFACVFMHKWARG